MQQIIFLLFVFIPTWWKRNWFGIQIRLHYIQYPVSLTAHCMWDLQKEPRSMLILELWWESGKKIRLKICESVAGTKQHTSWYNIIYSIIDPPFLLFQNRNALLIWNCPNIWHSMWVGKNNVKPISKLQKNRNELSSTLSPNSLSSFLVQ